MSLKKRILIVEDVESELERYFHFATVANIEATTALNLSQALEAISKLDFDYILTDIYLSAFSQEKEGLHVLKNVRENSSRAISIAMTIDPSEDIYEEVLDAGASYLIRKPLINIDDFLLALRMGTERWQLQRAVSQAKTKPLEEQHPHVMDGIVVSPQVQKILNSAIHRHTLPVVFYGETGTGKEELAKLIHRKRNRLEKTQIPFISVNCAILEGDIATSALFGHKKGTFTGANQDVSGYVGEAHGGILFLDEIHHLDLKCQGKLLRVLNDGSYNRLGDTKVQYSQFQLVAATTKDLDQLVEEGSFLVDLRSRLLGFEIFLPPLRDRFEDLELFIKIFFSKEKIHIEPLELKNLVEKCKEFYWQGNIRQLFRVLSTLISFSIENNIPIKTENLHIYKSMLAPHSSSSHPLSSFSSSTSLENLYPPWPDLVKKGDMTLEEAVDDMEKWIVKDILTSTSSLQEAQDKLGLKRTAFFNKRKKHNLL